MYTPDHLQMVTAILATYEYLKNKNSTTLVKSRIYAFISGLQSKLHRTLSDLNNDLI